MKPATGKAPPSRLRESVAMPVACVLMAMASLVFLMALFDTPTEGEPMELLCTPMEGEPTKLRCTATKDEPSGQWTGAYAAIIAMTAAGLALLKTAGARERARRWWDLLIGLVIMASAYLWLAVEAGVHPRDPATSVGLMTLLAATAAAMLLVMAPVLISIFADRKSKRDG